MNRSFAALALAGGLAACGPASETVSTSVTTQTDATTGETTVTTTTTTRPGSADTDNPLVAGDAVGLGDCDQPLVPEGEDCTETTETTTVTITETGGDDLYATEASDDLTVSDMSFDTATGELVLDNVPFDGDDNIFTRNAAASAAIQAASGTSFDAYENVAGFSNYYAVFRRSPGDFSQVGAMGTDRYISFGFGGAAVQRIDGTGALPNANESYVFNGEYAAVRTLVDPDTGSSIQYVSGTTRIEVDIEDFNEVGAVEGIIANRRFFDVNGVQIAAGNQTDFISMATARINFDDWTITSSNATLVIPNSVPRPDNGLPLSAQSSPPNPTTQSQQGTWDGLFAGPNGEEVAGFVFVEGTGPVGVDTSTGQTIILTEGSIRETGVFQAQR